MTQLTLALLGPPEIRHGGQLLTFPTRKALALLIYLAVEGGMQPREKLATLLWPESSHKAGRASLRTTLASLRKVLAHTKEKAHRPHLHVERQAIGFNRDAPYELDLTSIQHALDKGSDKQDDDLTRLQAAVEHHRGEFLEGFSLPDTPQFDAWVTQQQEQWHLRLSQLFDRLAQRQTERGETAAAITTLNRWLTLNPWEERAYRRLMQAHMTLGDRPGAIQVYEKCEAVLEADLGVAPAPETAALAAQIRSGREQGQTAAEQKPLSTTSPSFSLPLVGRQAEHRQLVAAYHHAQHGRTQIITLEGEAGIGKTRLARQFLQWASAQGALTLHGRAFETGGRLPYQPLINALRPLWQDDAQTGKQASLSPPWLAELSRLFPDLHDLYPDLPAPTSDETAAQTRLFEAVTRLGQRLSAESPLLLFIDDIQWADAASLDLLQYAAHRWVEADAPLVLLVGLRSEALARAEKGQIDSALHQWLSRLERALPLTRQQLTPLSKADTEQLITSLGIPEEEVDSLTAWLFAETGGQPFYLAETITSLLDEEVLVWEQSGTDDTRLTLSAAADETRLQSGFMPPGVRNMVVGRLARLSATAFDLLAAGAVLGQAFGYRQLCRVSGVAAEAGLTALDQLLAAHLLDEAETETARPYLFTHDKIRDVVYTEAGAARRRLFHERAYTLLKEEETAAAQIAHHALAAGLIKPAFIHTVAAGDNAMTLFAVRDAVEQYEQAHSLLRENPALKAQVEAADIHHLYRRLGRGYELLDSWKEAQQIGEEMLAVAEEIETPSMKVTALNRLAAVAIQSRLNVDEAAELLETAVAIAETHNDEEGLAETEWNLAQTCFHSRDRAGAIQHAERALKLAQALKRTELIARSHNLLSYAKHGPAGLAQLAEAKTHAATGRELYLELSNRAMAIDCQNMLGSIALHVGQPTEAEAHLRQAWEASVDIGNVWGQANTGFNLAQALLEQGRYGEALAQAEKSVTAARSSDSTPLIGGTLTVRGSIYRALRAVDRALEDHLEAARTFESMPNPYITHILAADLCFDYALAGQWAEAHQCALEALNYDRADAWLFSAFHEWLLVKALLHGGDKTLAQQTVQQFGELIGDNPRYQIPYRRAQALLAEEAGELTKAVTNLEEALAITEKIGLPGEKWSLLENLVALKEAQGEPAAAAALQQQARKIKQTLTAQLDGHFLTDTGR